MACRVPSGDGYVNGFCRFVPDGILARHTAENRCGDDAVAVANTMAGWHRDEVGSIRNAGAEAGVMTPAIVMHDPLPQNAAQVIFVARDHPVQAFTADCANHAFAERVRLRGSHRCLENGQPHRRDRAIDALRVDAVVVVNEEAMRLLT